MTRRNEGSARRGDRGRRDSGQRRYGNLFH
jgi:hypothetical protein